MNNKPTLLKRGTLWVCIGNNLMTSGQTPEEAYRTWLSLEQGRHNAVVYTDVWKRFTEQDWKELTQRVVKKVNEMDKTFPSTRWTKEDYELTYSDIK